MTDTTAKEDVRTRWASQELEQVAQRMVEIQLARPGLNDLEAVRLAQFVLARQRVIKQWQNVKRLDPILVNLRASVADGTFVDRSRAGAAPQPPAAEVVLATSSAPALEEASALALPLDHVADIVPIAEITDGVLLVDEPQRQAQDEVQAKPRVDEINADEPQNAIESTLALPVVVFPNVVDTVVATQVDPVYSPVIPAIVDQANGPAGQGAFLEDDEISIDLYGDGTDVLGKPAIEFSFVDEQPANDEPESISEYIPTSLPSPAVPEFAPVVEKTLEVVNSLPTVTDVHVALVTALSALVAPEALDKVLRSLAIEGPLESLAAAFEKAFADERAGTLDQRAEHDATDTKIFVAGFAGKEQKSIENALCRYDLRVWTPSKGPQAFESMAKICTIAVISEGMGDEVDEMLRSLKIKIVTHQGSTSRLAERITEMV